MKTYYNYLKGILLGFTRFALQFSRHAMVFRQKVTAITAFSEEQIFIITHRVIHIESSKMLFESAINFIFNKQATEMLECEFTIS